MSLSGNIASALKWVGYHDVMGKELNSSVTIWPDASSGVEKLVQGEAGAHTELLKSFQGMDYWRRMQLLTWVRQTKRHFDLKALPVFTALFAVIIASMLATFVKLESAVAAQQTDVALQGGSVDETGTVILWTAYVGVIAVIGFSLLYAQRRQSRIDATVTSWIDALEDIHKRQSDIDYVQTKDAKERDENSASVKSPVTGTSSPLILQIFGS